MSGWHRCYEYWPLDCWTTHPKDSDSQDWPIFLRSRSDHGTYCPHLIAGERNGSADPRSWFIWPTNHLVCTTWTWLWPRYSRDMSDPLYYVPIHVALLTTDRHSSALQTVNHIPPSPNKGWQFSTKSGPTRSIVFLNVHRFRAWLIRLGQTWPAHSRGAGRKSSPACGQCRKNVRQREKMASINHHQQYPPQRQQECGAGNSKSYEIPETKLTASVQKKRSKVYNKLWMNAP